MNYSNMIKTEDTETLYDAWKDYRVELTGYISKILKEHCKARSWLSIWGAGGCNDIDILELSQSYNLLLIDRDLDKLISVRERLGLSSETCKVADVGFWNVRDEDYEIFEALLMDGAAIEEFQIFFKDLVNNMTSPINLDSYAVDCSVVVGLASQLNARFAALLHLHSDKISRACTEELIQLLNNMNKVAVEKLFVSVRQLTRSLIITGYEAESCYSEKQALEVGGRLKACFEEGQDGGSYLSGREEAYIKVAGNELWHRLIYKGILMDKLEDAGSCQVINWQFTKEKLYPMLMVAVSIT